MPQCLRTNTKVGHIFVNCDVDALDAREDTQNNYVEASSCLVKEALLSPNAPTRLISGLWMDVNWKPIVGYFGDSDIQADTHSIPVSSLVFNSYIINDAFC